MRKYLTIGELADIMQVATSSIRYYEKEGLLAPCKIDDNGYRLYDFNELDKLETILLLRKLDVPLKQLKTLINNYSIDDYIEILDTSLSSIDSKIEQLKNKRRDVSKKLDYVQSFKRTEKHYHMVDIPERVLYCLHTGKIFEYTIKETYDIMKSKNIDNLDIYQDIYIIPYDNNTYSFCILKTFGMESFERFDKIILNEGPYLCHDIFVKNEDEIYIEIANFYDYIKNNALYSIGKLIVIENMKSSQFQLNGRYYSLQILIKS
ncbi:MerR family transcriptional regulator [Wukongibacter baidiensis]|uniref:helix-turn-helix domain-containing protein n=1 Tax=Wukongibacter baidiensis TaxID=1723361 RepID=UPI003D7F2317